MDQIRYCKQRNKFTCNPTNILNAAKWAGRDVTFKRDFERIKGLLQWEGKGARDPGHSILRQEIAPARAIGYMLGASIEQLEGFLDRPEHAVAFIFLPDHELEQKRQVYHETLIVGQKDGKFSCTNAYNQKGPALQQVDRQRLAEWTSPDRQLFHRHAATYTIYLTKGDEPVWHGEQLKVQAVPFHETIRKGDVALLGLAGAFVPFDAGDSIIGLTYMDLLMHSINHPRSSLFYRPIE